MYNIKAAISTKKKESNSAKKKLECKAIAIEESPAKKAKMSKPLSSAISKEIFLDDTVVSAKEGSFGKSLWLSV